MGIIHDEWKKQKPVEAKETTKPKTTAVAADNSAKPVDKVSSLPKAFQDMVTVKAADLALSQVLKPLASSVKYNVLFGPGIEGKKISVDLSNVSFEQALRNMLFPLGYGFKAQEGNLIILAQETRIFRVNLPPVQQSFDDVTSNESSVQPSEDSNSKSSSNQQVKLGTKVLVENSAAGISFWNDIENNLRTLVSSTGQFSLNKPAGSIVVTDTPPILEKVGAFFDDLNWRVSQQIEVDVQVVEVSLNHENRLGIDWNMLAQNLKEFNAVSMATNFAAQNFTGGSFFTFSAESNNNGAGVTDNGVRFVLDALSKQGDVEVVSQPKVVILNNQVAVIQVGSTQSYVDSSKVETTTTGTVTSLSTSQVQEGVTMRLLGNIVGERIYLSVTPVVTTIDNIRSISSGNTTIEAPQTTTKSINTLVKLTAGETVAIGGLITSYKQKTKQGVPGISKIPVLGRLFEYNQNKNTKSELVIFITPKKV